MRMLRIESLRVVLLDTRYRLMRIESVSVGSMNESIAHPREIFRPAITYSAYAVIVVHDHPSGDPSPSQTDHSLTRRLAEAAELLQIKLLDHIVIGAPSDTQSRLFQFQRGRRVVGKKPKFECRNPKHDGEEGSSTAIVDSNAKVGANVEIGAVLDHWTACDNRRATQSCNRTW